MTPSQWHDDVRGRDAGHDEMQIAVFDYLRDMSGPSPFYDTADFERIGVYFELMFKRRGQIIAWGDVVEVWGKEAPLYNNRKETTHKYMIWEIKPRIYSIGAVVRQCRALIDVVTSSLTDDHTDRTKYQIMIAPVVAANDPKLVGLRHVYCAATWDGERLS